MVKTWGDSMLEYGSSFVRDVLVKLQKILWLNVCRSGGSFLFKVHGASLSGQRCFIGVRCGDSLVGDEVTLQLKI